MALFTKKYSKPGSAPGGVLPARRNGADSKNEVMKVLSRHLHGLLFPAQRLDLMRFPPCIRLMLFTCLFCLATTLPASERQDTLHVLILNGYDESVAPYFRATEAFRETLLAGYGTPIAFNEIDLGQRGAGAPDNDDKILSSLLLARYGTEPPRLVVAIGPPAIDFWVRNRDSNFPAAGFIATAAEQFLQRSKLQPGDVSVVTPFTFTGAVENILLLRPETANILMVFGDSYTERAFAATARRELAPYASRLRLEFTNDLSFTEVQEKAAHLGPDSVVFFGIFSSDVNGVSLPRYSGLSVVSAVSKVPVFGPFDDQLGKGIIGGSLIQSTKIGEEIAAAAQDLLSGQSDTGAVRRVELSEPTYDWRELEAWGIDLDTLPPGSTILFQPAGIWKQFRVWIVLAAIIFLSQSILLLTLLHQSRRRREAEIARESLSRRLITVQENERRLIARELHDDLSQRLARATLDVSFVRSGPAGPATEEVLKQLHPDLVKISKDIHDMSYRLHPSLVEDLGIAAAFRSEIDRAQRRTDAKITARIGEISEHLPDEKALSIFRIGQEALQNAIKHADAATIEITLEPRGHGLKLIVQDDGAGFDVTDKQAKFSIGLSSMKERTHLVNGVLNIRSRPGKGTTVTLSVAGKAGSI